MGIMGPEKAGKGLDIGLFILAECALIEKFWLLLSMIACVTDEVMLGLYVEITANASCHVI